MRDPQNIDVLGERRNRRFGGLVWAVPMAALVAVADQITKQWALDRLVSTSCDVPEACIDLIFGAKFHLVFNTGAAFARGQGFGPVLGILVFIISVILLVVAWRRTDKVGALLLGAIAGGAIGNLFDRVTRAEDGFLSGAVVDFVDVGWWPVFNVADAAVVCGVVGFVGLSWFQDRPVDIASDMEMAGGAGVPERIIEDDEGVDPDPESDPEAQSSPSPSPSAT